MDFHSWDFIGHARSLYSVQLFFCEIMRIVDFYLIRACIFTYQFEKHAEFCLILIINCSSICCSRPIILCFFFTKFLKIKNWGLVTDNSKLLLLSLLHHTGHTWHYTATNTSPHSTSLPFCFWLAVNCDLLEHFRHVTCLSLPAGSPTPTLHSTPWDKNRQHMI